MNKKRNRIIFFMCYIRNTVVSMQCNRCPFYKLTPDNRGICFIARNNSENIDIDCEHYLCEELNMNHMRMDLNRKDWVMIV